MTIQVAETNKSKRSPKKVLAHLEIHPQLGGGHLVRHVYHGFGHEPAEYNFNAQGIMKGGEHITGHLAKHAGLPRAGDGTESYDHRDESETEDEIKA